MKLIQCDKFDVRNEHLRLTKRRFFSIIIVEKDKCDELKWFKDNEIPMENVIPFMRSVFNNKNFYISHYYFI